MRSMSKCFNIVYLAGGFTAGQFLRNDATRQFHSHQSSAMSFPASPPKAALVEAAAVDSIGFTALDFDPRSA